MWARNSEVTDSILPELELVRDFMTVLVTNKFDEDPIKNEQASLEKPFSHYKLNPSEILCMSSLPASIKRIGSETTEKMWRHHNMSIENLIRPQGHVIPSD